MSEEKQRRGYRTYTRTKTFTEEIRAPGCPKRSKEEDAGHTLARRLSPKKSVLPDVRREAKKRIPDIHSHEDFHRRNPCSRMSEENREEDTGHCDLVEWRIKYREADT